MCSRPLEEAGRVRPDAGGHAARRALVVAIAAVVLPPVLALVHAFALEAPPERGTGTEAKAHRMVVPIARDMNVATVGGPLSGYVAARQPAGLGIEPVAPEIYATGLPLTFDSALVGVRAGDTAVRDERAAR